MLSGIVSVYIGADTRHLCTFAELCAQRFGIKPLEERIVKGVGCGAVGGIDLMKKKRKNILLIAGMLLV
jgi:hypothetical protein